MISVKLESTIETIKSGYRDYIKRVNDMKERVRELIYREGDDYLSYEQFKYCCSFVDKILKKAGYIGEASFDYDSYGAFDISADVANNIANMYGWDTVSEEDDYPRDEIAEIDGIPDHMAMLSWICQNGFSFSVHFKI